MSILIEQLETMGKFLGPIHANRIKEAIDRVELLENNWMVALKERDQARAEAKKWQLIRTPGHGTCCTCQKCGKGYDECRCDLDDVVDELEKVKNERDDWKSAAKRNLSMTELANHLDDQLINTFTDPACLGCLGKATHHTCNPRQLTDQQKQNWSEQTKAMLDEDHHK